MFTGSQLFVDRVEYEVIAEIVLLTLFLHGVYLHQNQLPSVRSKHVTISAWMFLKVQCRLQSRKKDSSQITAQDQKCFLSHNFT